MLSNSFGVLKCSSANSLDPLLSFKIILEINLDESTISLPLIVSFSIVLIFIQYYNLIFNYANRSYENLFTFTNVYLIFFIFTPRKTLTNERTIIKVEI